MKWFFVLWEQMKANPENQILMLMDRKPVSKTIGNRRLSRRAWAYRKMLAAAHGVRPAFVNWGTCLKLAAGRKVKPLDAFGCHLEGKYSRINLHLVDKAPVIIDPEVVAAKTGESLKEILMQMNYLRTKGFLTLRYGFWNVNNEARPYPQPLAEM